MEDVVVPAANNQPQSSTNALTPITVPNHKNIDAKLSAIGLAPAEQCLWQTSLHPVKPGGGEGGKAV